MVEICSESLVRDIGKQTAVLVVRINNIDTSLLNIEYSIKNSKNRYSRSMALGIS